jgi:hypothetical protein
VVLVALVAIVLRATRHRRLPTDRASARAVAELGAALAGAGLRMPAGPTLLSIENRLRVAGKRRAGDYARALREQRFGSGSAAPPGLRQRFAARRELARGRGLGGRLRLLAAMPPGGPRRAPGEGRLPS